MTSYSMEKFAVCGLSYKTTPVELRERLALSAEELERFYKNLSGSVLEAMIISTCNRVEVYTISEDAADKLVRDELLSRLGVNDGDFFYRHVGPDALRHLFCVTSGLDSMVLGEPQIAGQVKEAYLQAVKLGAARSLISQFAHQAFRVSKRIRTETDVQRQPVSVPYTAVILAEQIFGDLAEKSVLLVGAGEMCSLAAEHLVERKIAKLYVANRSVFRSEELATRFSGEVVPFERYPDLLADVDIVITSTSSRDFIIGEAQVQEAMHRRKHRPMFFIDIGVPRDIDPAVNNITNAYLFDIDDLQKVVDENIEERKKAAGEAERIIREEMTMLDGYFGARNFSQVITELAGELQKVRRAELGKVYQKCPGLEEAERGALERHTDLMLRKILHPAISWLKDSSADPCERISIIRQIFGMEKDKT